ncbi:MAG: hypothetical protein KA797_04205, partial [Chitinophagales bacterium]|nr:hypothetical protein [Chitinophagales bacterium]
TNPPIGTDSIPASDVVGYAYRNGHFVAKYWKNGVATDLSDGTTNVKAYSISISNNDVFICGEYNDPNTYFNAPKLWKNGSEIALSVVYPGAGVDKNNRGYAKSIAAYNGNSYTAGYVTDGGGSFSVAALWVNGGLPTLLCPRLDQDLKNGDSYAEAVFVADNGDVYVAGEQHMGSGLGNKQIVMWKNGVKTQLTNYTLDVNGFPGQVTSMFVSGADVYITCSYMPEESGVSKQKVAYFKNGVLHIVSDASLGAYAHSIYVKNNDVYVVGFNGSSSTPLLWKNDVLTNLSTIKYGGTVRSVFVKNTDVYACGESDNKAKATIWKNNKIYALTDGTDYNTATDLVIR